MIEKQTVIVLGAGASADFGFPIGGQLVTQICHALSNDSSVPFNALLELGHQVSQIHRFIYALQHSASSSVDIFLEHRPEFISVGKAAIASALIPYENGEVLHQLPGTFDNWLSLLFNRMTAKQADWDGNKLAVVTFNYDRSFERFFLDALTSRYGLPLSTSAKMFSDTVQVIHVHGVLGGLFPLVTSDAREYVNRVTSTDIAIAANQIKIVVEATDSDPEFRKARELLKTAEQIVCLGFGYHPTNVQRLFGELSSDRRIPGSAYRMTAAERDAVNRSASFRFRLDDSGHNVYDYLRHSPLLRA